MVEPGLGAPERLEHERFVAVPLTREVAALDDTTYMASPGVIRVHSAGRWPVEGFTFEQDLELIAQHESDHATGRSFAFVLLEPAATTALGCLYLNRFRLPLATEGIPYHWYQPVDRGPLLTSVG